MFCLLSLALFFAQTEIESAAWDLWQCDHYLPPNKLAYALMTSASKRRQSLANNTGPDRNDAEHRFNVWVEIFNASNKDCSQAARRKALRRLINLVGPEAYLRGWWPNPVPTKRLD